MFRILKAIDYLWARNISYKVRNPKLHHCSENAVVTHLHQSPHQIAEAVQATLNRIISQISGPFWCVFGEMPLYDCMLLLKPHVKKEALMDLVARVGKHVYRRNGVVTDLKSFGEVQLGYGIRKLDGRYYQGQLMQMTMMATPNINKELQYLHKEDRLLRWLIVKHRNTKFGLEFMNDEIRLMDATELPRSSLFDIDRDDEDDADATDEDNDDYKETEDQMT